MRKPKRFEHAFAYLIGALACIGFPAFWTAVAPVSYVSLMRDEAGVSASAYTCTLFVVPYRIQHVQSVFKSGDRIHHGEYSRSTHRRGRDHQTRSEDEGFLSLEGESGVLEVSVSPFSLKSKLEQVNQFMEDEHATKLDLFCVSNWKFGVLAGGPICLLTVLYVVGVATLIVQGIRKLFGLLLK